MERIIKLLFSLSVLALLSSWGGILYAAQDSAPKIKQVNYTATLEKIEGEVLVYKGNKYLPAKNEMTVKDGNRLMVMKNSKVKLVYENGCSEVVESFRIFKVDMDACHLGFYAKHFKPYVTPRNGLALAGLGLLDPNKKKRRAPVSP